MFIDRPAPRTRALNLGLNLKFGSPLFLSLAWKEIWRYKGRYFLISLVIALITVLVLFVAGLAEGLGAGNREYLEKLNADLILYQDSVDLSIPSSRLDHSKLNDVRRVEGVKAVGSLGFSNASIVLDGDQEPLKISLIGVEPGKPGEPPAYQGRNLAGKRDKEAVIDRNVALRTGLNVGDQFTLKTVQGTEEEFYTLAVVGISDGRQYSIQPSVFVPHLTWDRIKPKASLEDEKADLIFNSIAVQLDNPAEQEFVAQQLASRVNNIQAVDRKTAYENTPGYQAQQSTLNTQRLFTLLIGVLVIGGFFPNSNVTESGPDWNAEGHRRVEFDDCVGFYCSDRGHYDFGRRDRQPGHTLAVFKLSGHHSNYLHPRVDCRGGFVAVAHRAAGWADLVKNFIES